MCKTRVHLRYAKMDKDHGAPACETYCNLHAHHGWATEVKFLMSRADRNRKTLCCSTMFPLCGLRAPSSGCTSCRWGSAGLAREGRHLLVLDALGEQVVGLVVDWRPTYCPLFIQGKSMNMCELARVFFLSFFFQLNSARRRLLFASPKLHGNLNRRCLRSVRYSLIRFILNSLFGGAQ